MGEDGDGAGRDREPPISNFVGLSSGMCQLFHEDDGLMTGVTYSMREGLLAGCQTVLIKLRGGQQIPVERAPCRACFCVNWEPYSLES